MYPNKPIAKLSWKQAMDWKNKYFDMKDEYKYTNPKKYKLAYKMLGEVWDRLLQLQWIRFEKEYYNNLHGFTTNKMWIMLPDRCEYVFEMYKKGKKKI